MDLLIIRHGIAVDSEDWMGADDLRPLTDEGVRKMREAAEGLRTLVDVIDVLVASPLVRAQQTAHLVASEFDVDVVEISETLAPDQDPPLLLEWLVGLPPADVVAIVGHEPHLSTLATWLLCGEDDSKIELRKGAACLLRFDEEPKAGAATLVWLLPPAQLRALSR
jgi:phosphohistidine phosphatase